MASVLQITPHAVFPPRGGRRAFFFLREMAREHQVVAILPQTLDSLRGTREGYRFPANVDVRSPLDTPPPRTLFDGLPSRLRSALKYRWLRRSWRGPAYGTLLDDYHLIADVLRQKRIEIVIFDHLETIHSCAPSVRRLSPKSFLMLNAHNVDSELYAQQLKATAPQDGNSQLLRTYLASRRVETHLSEYVDAFWACSEMDRDRLDRMNESRIPGFFVPNGIATELLPFDANPNKRTLKRLLFCGALNYTPNRRGLEWFHRAIWPLIRAKDPEIRLVVIGYGAAPRDFTAVRTDPAVDFIGEVDTVAPYYHETSLSVVPLLQGSGTRVKILEAMSLGSPVVSTTIGAEGIPAESGTHLALADDPAIFAEAILGLLNDEAFYQNLRQAARQLIKERFDWRILGKEINRIIDEVARN
jgi:glycosyltransferase involved in cell wall biosynthesis